MQRWLNFLGKIGILIGLCLWLGQAFAADIQVRVDRNPVGFNESFLIEFSAGRKVDADPDFSVLKLIVCIRNGHAELPKNP